MSTHVNYISMITKPDRFHRYPIIVHKNHSFYFAGFQNIGQLDFFARTLGFSYSKRKENDNGGVVYTEMNMSHGIEEHYFWCLSEIPLDAKPIKAHSNGSIVTCYFVTTADTIHFYRPNPNAKEVYKPLPLDDHIAHNRIYGSY